jgi:hypothetical protein
MNREILDSFFTKESLLSLQGSVALTLLVPNVLAYLIGSSFAPYTKWVAFGVAMLLAFLVASQAPERSVTKWVLAVLNAFLIFASAVGLTVALGSGATGMSAGGGGVTPFFQDWYP